MYIYVMYGGSLKSDRGGGGADKPVPAAGMAWLARARYGNSMVGNGNL